MNRIILFIHVLGALVLGFYLLLPVLLSAVGKAEMSGKGKIYAGIRRVNTIAMFVLIVQLLTGGFLMSQGSFAPGWMAGVLILLVAVGAFTGMMGSRMKKAAASDDAAAAGGVVGLAWVNAVVLALMVLFMVFPMTR